VGSHVADDSLIEDVAVRRIAHVEPKIGTVTVGQKRAPGGDVGAYEGVDGFLTFVGDQRQSDPLRSSVAVEPIEIGPGRLPRAPVNNLYRANDFYLDANWNGLIVTNTEWNLRLIHFDDTAQRLPLTVCHRGSKFVKKEPSRVVVDADLVRQLECRDTVRVRSD
jgi:hypothetical protein